MLSKTIDTALNSQVAMEAYSSFQYLAMASWLENKGFTGSAQFLYKQVEEEHMHMLKLFHYINEAGGQARAPELDKCRTDYKTFADVFQDALANERKISAAIHDLVDLALKEKDYTTFNFLQWYVSEQLEEENQFKQINDKIEMLGENRDALYLLDRDLANMPNTAVMMSNTTK